MRKSGKMYFNKFPKYMEIMEMIKLIKNKMDFAPIVIFVFLILKGGRLLAKDGRSHNKEIRDY